MNKILILFCVLGLGGCVYAETPDGRFAALDVALPTHSTTTVHKTVTVNAPAGTTVHISETPLPAVIHHDCYFDRRMGRRVCAIR